MSDTDPLLRRDVLKASGAASLAMAAGGGGALQLLQQTDGADADRESYLGDNETYYSVCSPNCRGKCPLEVHVRDGQIRAVEQQVPANEQFRRGCTLGLSHVQRVYNSTRLKYPMVRSSWSVDDPQPEKRGEDAQFERVSWDEALDLVAEGIRRTQREYGEESMLWHTGSGDSGTTGFSRLTQLIGGTVDGTPGIDTNVGRGFLRVTGEGSTYLPPTNPNEDWVNAGTIIIWGSDIFASQFQQDAQWILDAKRAGAKLVVVDPMYTNTAEKADLWLPIEPGKDVYLALGMMHWVFENDAYDAEFLRTRTNAPALVRTDTGELLRATEVFDDAEEGDIVVIDEATGEPTAVGPETGGDFALFGEYTVDGVETRTGLTELRDHAADYPLDEVASVTSLDEGDIRTTIEWFTSRGSGGIMPSYGVGRYLYGHVFGQAYATLMALTGDYGNHGNIHSQYANYSGSYLQTGDWGSPENAKETSYVGEADKLDALQQGEYKAMYGMQCNDINQYPERQSWIEAIRNVDMVAWADIHHTPTTQHADIILPAAHWFETEDVMTCYTHPNIGYREKAQEPLWESRDDYYILRGLAERFGYGDQFPEDKRTVLKSFVENDDRFSWNELRENGTVATDETPSPFYTGEFGTDTGRIELYDDDAPTERGPNLPEEGVSLELPEPIEGRTTDDYETADDYPLIFMQKHSKWRIHSQYESQPWLREINPQPQLDIHPEDAQRRGIDDGEYVRVFNDRGEMVVKAKYNEGIRPGLVNTDQGWYTRDFVQGHLQDLISEETAEVGQTFAYYDVRVQVESAPDDVDTGQYTDGSPTGAGAEAGGD
ncbi:molybdopterin-dependent oxidoreductase [Halostella litorea]|uniref:molybdopterin-dependent oxidoreductase n=1 Tax=Halostella litorea TaxID=2528831 RepID=UPI001092A72D|nr:molybdopterin-dependent oxidoreductase [Halostella litorea]